MTVSLTEITDIMYTLLREEWPSSAYPLTLMELMANAGQQDFCAGRVIHPITGEEAQAGDLHFLNADAYYSNVKITTLTSDTTIGAVELFADTTDYPTTGNLYVGWQVLTYTGITTTSFTGVTGISFPFIAWTQVSIAFALPTDFSDIKEVIYNNKFVLPPKDFDTMHNDLNDFKGSNVQRNNTTAFYESQYRVQPFYTIKDAQYLIVFQLNESDKPIHLRYEKMPPEMTSTGLLPVGCAIDNDIYAKITIPYLAVAMVMYERWEEDRGSAVYNNAIKNCRKAYNRYADSLHENPSGKVYRSGHGKRNI